MSAWTAIVPALGLPPVIPQSMPGPSPIPAPVPPPAILTAYYLDWSFYGNFRSEIAGDVSAFLIWDYFMGGDLVALRASFVDAVGHGKPILFGPALSPADTSITPTALAGLTVAKDYWSSITGLYLDESSLSDALRHAIASMGLPPKPIWANFTKKQFQDGTVALSIVLNLVDVIGYEAYVDPSAQNDPTILGILDADCRQFHTIIGPRPFFVVVQGYDRNGLWTNMQSLQQIQSEPYRQVYADPNFRGLLIFSWARPGGSRSLPRAIHDEQRKVLVAARTKAHL